MSTRVYTGFKFVSRSMRDIVIALGSIKTDIEQLQRNRYLKAYACLLVSLLDRSQSAIESGKTGGMVSAMPGRQVRDGIQKRQAHVRATLERDPAVDLEVELRCWYSQLRDEVIGYAYGEFDGEVLRLLIEKGVATNYAYWNSTDPDEDVPENEWEQRKAAWNEALDDKSGACFVFRYDGRMADLPLTWAELEPLVPSLDFRASELAESDLFSSWYEALPDKSADSADVLNRHSEFRRLLREDPTMKEKLSAEIERRKLLLVKGEALDNARKQKQLLVPLRDFD
ncbi:hypothetical protein G3A43_07100 [Paraburkholderia aspalathi]|nr:hypothetical protein [Paraburkholderia aspalathi]MBK3780019.1 hypothetical protein [Paraburkholderia aspalathi]